MLKIYLLKYEDPRLISDTAFMEAATEKIDSRRKNGLQKMKKNSAGRAASIAAGLLIQYAYEKNLSEEDSECVRVVSLDEVLDSIQKVRDIRYRIGREGKPYFEGEGEPYFNISHAGGYAAIAISDREVGIDIQNRRNTKTVQMADRFFSKEEKAAVRADKSGELFFRLWTRKEALGKCTGEGVRPYLDVNILNLGVGKATGYEWTEDVIEECFMTVCLKR